MIPDLDIYRSAQVFVKGTRAFPVPREGPGFSYRSSSEVSLTRSAFPAVSCLPRVRSNNLTNPSELLFAFRLFVELPICFLCQSDRESHWAVWLPLFIRNFVELQNRCR